MGSETRERPLLWKQRTTDRWPILIPLLLVEWAMEWIVYWADRWAFVELVKLVGSLSILWAAGSYLLSADQRLQSALDQKKAKHYAAWQIINSGVGRRSDSGRSDAIQDLIRDGVSLAGIDLHDALLNRIEAANAEFSGANFKDTQIGMGSCFQYAGFSSANLEGADFSGADLQAAILSLANLKSADLSVAALGGATFYGSDLRYAKLNYTMAKDQIDDANIYGATSDDPNFLSNAIAGGAVCIPSDDDWAKFQRAPRSEKTRTYVPADCIAPPEEKDARIWAVISPRNACTNGEISGVDLPRSSKPPASSNVDEIEPTGSVSLMPASKPHSLDNSN